MSHYPCLVDAGALGTEFADVKNLGGCWGLSCLVLLLRALAQSSTGCKESFRLVGVDLHLGQRLERSGWCL